MCCSYASFISFVCAWFDVSALFSCALTWMKETCFGCYMMAKKRYTTEEILALLAEDNEDIVSSNDDDIDERIYESDLKCSDGDEEKESATIPENIEIHVRKKKILTGKRLVNSIEAALNMDNFNPMPGSNIGKFMLAISVRKQRLIPRNSNLQQRRHNIKVGLRYWSFTYNVTPTSCRHDYSIFLQVDIFTGCQWCQHLMTLHFIQMDSILIMTI